MSDNTFTFPAMSRINLVNYYEQPEKEIGGKKIGGYKADTKKCMCPDCYAVNVHRRAKKQENRAEDLKFLAEQAKSVFLFYKEGAAPVAACACGFRKCNGKIYHSAAFKQEFGEQPPAEVPEDRKGKCTEICKSTKKPCKNDAVPGSNKCHMHGGKRMY